MKPFRPKQPALAELKFSITYELLWLLYVCLKIQDYCKKNKIYLHTCTYMLRLGGTLSKI
jgi:hypothetical protein